MAVPPALPDPAFATRHLVTATISTGLTWRRIRARLGSDPYLEGTIRYEAQKRVLDRSVLDLFCGFGGLVEGVKLTLLTRNLDPPNKLLNYPSSCQHLMMLWSWLYTCSPFALAEHRYPTPISTNAVDIGLVCADHPVDVDQALVAALRGDLFGGQFVAIDETF